MNEVTRIHLSRTTYEIDIDAKKDLEKYIAAIKRSLDDAEIMDDIELRMSEILNERGVGKDGVITAGDVAAIRAQLGEPRDFADSEDSNSEDWRDNLFTRGKDDGSGAYKKYYRDEENGILGGVAAGLSAYTGWDLTLVRVAFAVASILSFGWAVLIYIIVWIAAPAARTVSERLEMRGTPITLENLSNSEFGERAKKNARAFADDVKEKVDDIKSKAKKSKNEIKDDAREIKENAKTYAANIKADVKEEIRARYEEPRGSINPVAAIFGAILYCIGFSIFVSTIVSGIVATIVLLQNPFAKEVWLWLALAAWMVAGFTAVGFFMASGQALLSRRRRRHVANEIAGAFGATVMFGLISAVMMGAWLWSIPEDYKLPKEFTHSVQRFDKDICKISVGWNRVEISRKCD